MKKKNSPRIVTIDIETSPLLVQTWGIWEQNVLLENIKRDWTILSFCAKWMDDDKVIYRDTGGRGVNKVFDDKGLVKELRDILDEADIVIGQNHKSFDIKKINSRILEHKIAPYSPIKVVDTKIVAKKNFAFTSNKLAFMTEKLTKIKKDKHKHFPGMDLWNECMAENPKAWAEMKKYNILDVLATEELYLLMRPWVEGHPNMAVYSEVETPACPKCGSEKIQKRGEAVTQTGRYHRFQCQDCSGWSRSRYVTNTKEKRKSLLSN